MPEDLTGNDQDEDFKFPENPREPENSSAQVLRFLGKIHADEAFCDPQHTREYIDDLEFDSFKDLLLSTNALIRGIPITERSADGENVYLTGGYVDNEDIPPKFEDKEGLLLETFQAIKRMNNGEAPFENVAILLGACINAIHLFNDANGRTSRLAYSLVKDGYRGTQEDNEHINAILGKYGRQIIDINPGIIKSELNAKIFEHLTGANPMDPLIPTYFWGNAGRYKKELQEALSVRDDISSSDREFLVKITCSDEGKQLQHGFLAVAKALSSKGKLLDHVKTFEEDGKPARSPLLIGEAIAELDSSDIAEIREAYWAIKKMYVEFLIGSIETPEEFTTVDREGDQVTIFSEFKKVLDRRAA